MTKKLIILSLCASTMLSAQSELEELKALLAQQMKMTQALQKRVVQLEKKQAIQSKITKRQDNKIRETKKQIAVVQTQKEEQPTVQAAATFDQKSFLPDIALILNGSTVARNVPNSTYASYYIPGFSTYNANTPTVIPFNKERGFNFNYAELALHSTVGPWFDADAIFHLRSDSFEIEEAYLTTRALPYALKAKLGKFRSNFGRINAKHQHSWHFSSQPLVFEAMLGSEGINDAGVQLQWVLPTEDTYVMAGFEALQGINDVSFGDTETNNLYIGYLKSSFDITDDATALLGASILHGKNLDGFSTDIYGADFTVKTALDGYSSLLWQSELLYRNKKTTTSTQKQAGFYTQLIYQYDQNWAAGIRYDDLYKNLDTQPNNLDKYTTMIEYKPFEFTKFRLQYTYDRSKAFGLLNDERKNTSEILLGVTIEAGAHGAHAF